MIHVAVIGCGHWGPNLIRNRITPPCATLSWAYGQDRNRLDAALAPLPGHFFCYTGVPQKGKNIVNAGLTG